MKSLAILLILLTVASAVAPGWIDTGASLNYTSGGNAVSFTITGRTSTDITILLATSPPPHSASIKNNVSADSGQFWFDPSLLSHAYEGQTIDGLIVMAKGKETFAGQTWDAVTLQGTISGAQTTQIYDTKTGLLLKQTVDKEGVPDVVLSQYYIPAFAPPPPPVVVPPKQNTTTPLPTQQNANSSVTAPANSSNQLVSNSTEPAPPEIPPATQGNKTKAPLNFEDQSPSGCCSSLFILLLVGFVAIRGFRR